MPKTGSGGAVPDVSDAAVRSWYTFRHFNPGSAQDPRICYLTGYQRAAADMLADLFEFGGFQPLAVRLLNAIEFLAQQRAAVNTTTQELVDGAEGQSGTGSGDV